MLHSVRLQCSFNEQSVAFNSKSNHEDHVFMLRNHLKRIAH
jgi:hypothetical protein